MSITYSGVIVNSYIRKHATSTSSFSIYLLLMKIHFNTAVIEIMTPYYKFIIFAGWIDNMMSINKYYSVDRMTYDIAHGSINYIKLF